MKNLHTLDKYRDTQTERDYYHRRGDSGNGAFKVYINGRSFFCIASNGGGWERVSVSPCNRKRATPPTWPAVPRSQRGEPAKSWRACE